MNEENKIPLPDDDTAKKQQWELLRPYLLDPRDDYPEPYSI